MSSDEEEYSQQSYADDDEDEGESYNSSQENEPDRASNDHAAQQRPTA